MGRKKVISIRLDEELIDQIRKHGSLTRFIRNALKAYTENTNNTLPDDVEQLLSEFKQRVDEYVERVKQFCSDHAKEITSSHESEKDFDYWRDICLYRYRIITRHNLDVYAKLLQKYIRLDSNKRAVLEKKINEIIDYAINEIYSSQYPPIYPI